MNKKNLADLVKLIVESVNDEMEEMWMSTNEGPDPEWGNRTEQALQELDATLKTQDDPNFEEVLLMIQERFGLSDYQTFLVGENSSYPTRPDLWKSIAGGRFAKFAATEEPPEREYDEAGLTSEIREQLKREVKECIKEIVRECRDKSKEHDEPLIGHDGPSTTTEVTLNVDPDKKGVELKGNWNTLPPKQ